MKNFRIGNTFLSSEITKYFIFFILYCLLVNLVFASLTSVVSFFHFQLDHSLNIIQDWIFRNAWGILTLTKLISAYIIFRFMDLKIDSSYSIDNFIKKDFGTIPKPIFPVLIFLIFFYLLISKPQLAQYYEDTQVSHSLLSFIGVLIFYLSDFFIYAYLSYLEPMQGRWKRIFMMFFVSIIFWLNSVMLLPFAVNLDSSLFLHLFFAFYLLEVTKGGWMVPTLYLIVMVAFPSAFFGFDPIHSTEFTLFKPRAEFRKIYLITLFIISGIFLHYRGVKFERDL